MCVVCVAHTCVVCGAHMCGVCGAAARAPTRVCMQILGAHIVCSASSYETPPHAKRLKYCVCCCCRSLEEMLLVWWWRLTQAAR
jgi:hypothetical protein